MPSSTPQTPTIKISPPDSDLLSTPTTAPATATATATATPNPPPPPSRPPNHHSDSDISVLDLGPSMDTFHPTEPPATHTQPQQQPTLAPPTPLAVLPGTDALTIITTVPSTVPSTTTIANIDGETHASDDEEGGSTTPRPSAISFTTTTTSTSGSGQATPVPRRGRVLGSRGVLASLRAFSSPLLMPLRGDASSSSSHSSSAAAASASGSGSGSEIGSGYGSGRRVGGARPGVRRARTSLWGR